MARKYEPSWVKLKKNAEANKFNTTNQEGKIMLQITTSTNPKVINAHASTAIRGVQKEKYLDGAFRRKYSDALLTSSINLDNGMVTITLDLNDYSSLADI